jgi:chromosome segregation ATPase
VFKALMQKIGFQIVLNAMIGLNPVLVVPAIVAALVQGRGVMMKGINEKVKQDVGKHYATQLRDTGTEQSNKIADTVAEKFAELTAAVDAAMGTRIQDLRDQVESVLAKKRQGQAQVDQEAEELKTAHERLDAIDTKLDALEHEVAVTQERT